jgi:hypothetical protein
MHRIMTVAYLLDFPREYRLSNRQLDREKFDAFLT